MTTVSARPDNLAAYRAKLYGMDHNLRSTAGSLLQILETYRTSCPEFGANHTELADTLGKHATAMEELDGWVGRVGEAFRHAGSADSAPGPMPGGVVFITDESVLKVDTGKVDAEADAQIFNDGLKLPPGKDGLQQITKGTRTVALLNALLAAGHKLTDEERAYLDTWYNTVGADNLSKIPQYVRDAAPSMADKRRGPDNLPMETSADAAARLTREVLRPIADGIMNLSDPGKGGHNGLGQMPKAVQDLANTAIGYRADTGLRWPSTEAAYEDDLRAGKISPVDGLARFNGFADLMQASTVNGGTQFTKDIGEQAIRVKQDLNAVAGNVSAALQFGPGGHDPDQLYDALRLQTSDAAASHLLSVVGRNGAASSQLLLDQHDRQALLGLNWQDDHGAADVVRGGTNRDVETGGGTMDQANAALAVMQEVGSDRSAYLHRMTQGVKGAVVDTGITWMDSFGRESVPGTPSQADAHMSNIFGEDTGIGIQLSPDDRAHFLQFVSGTGDRDAMRFHAAAVSDSRSLVADALSRGNAVEVNAALDYAGRLDGAITAADYQYALDQTGDKHDQAVAAAEAEKRRNWAYSLASKVSLTGGAQAINVGSGGTASPFTAVGLAIINPLIDKVFEEPTPPPDPSLRLREDLFNEDRLANIARREYFLLSAANQAGVIPSDMQARADALYVHDEHGQVVTGPNGRPALKSYEEIVKLPNLLQSQSQVTDGSYQRWERAHNGDVDLQRYTEQRNSIANGSYWQGSPTNSPWHSDNGARVLLYGHNVSEDGNVDRLFSDRVPTNTANYYVPPWKRTK